MQREGFSVVYSGDIIQTEFLKSLEGSGIQAVLEDQFLEGWSLRCPERNEGARRQAFQAAEGLTPKHHRASS